MRAVIVPTTKIIMSRKLSGLAMKNLGFKKHLFSLALLFTLGLSGCSNPGVNGETSSVGGSVLQTSQSDASIVSKPAEDNLSPVSLLTYFDFDSAQLSA